jgi:hypothetical protein
MNPSSPDNTQPSWVPPEQPTPDTATSTTQRPTELPTAPATPPNPERSSIPLPRSILRASAAAGSAAAGSSSPSKSDAAVIRPKPILAVQAVQQPDSPPQIVYPPALQPGGFLDKARESAKCTTSRLGVAVAGSCDAVRTMYVSEFSRGSSDPPEQILALSIRRVALEWDPVLPYAVAMASGFPASDWLDQKDKALGKYIKQPEEYESVLNGLLPEELCNEGQGIIAQRKYEEGANDTADQDWGVYLRVLGSLRKRPLVGCSTGIPKLDEALDGLHGLTFLGAAPGSGKTSLALSIARAALLADPELAVLFLSLDMPKTRLYSRLLCNEATLEYRQLRKGNLLPEEKTRLVDAERRLKTDVLPRLRILEAGFFGNDDKFSYSTIIQLQNQLLSATGTCRVLTVLDYFALLETLWVKRRGTHILTHISIL